VVLKLMEREKGAWQLHFDSSRLNVFESRGILHLSLQSQRRLKEQKEEMKEKRYGTVLYDSYR